MTEQDFLKDYNVNEFKDRPSIATDVVILSMHQLGNSYKLEVLVTKRKDYPFKDMLQIPGGFVQPNLSLEDNVRFKLKDKITYPNLDPDKIHIEQLYTYGAVDRDPRTRVISVVYYSILPVNAMCYLPEESKAGTNSGWICPFTFNCSMAFDHKQIIEDTVKRLQGKLDYTDIAFEFLKSKKSFTLYELKLVYEAILNKKIGLANFRRDILKRYDDRLEVIDGLESTEFSKRPSKVYRLK